MTLNHKNREEKMSEFEIMGARNPEVAKFLENWKKKYGSRTFNMQTPEDQADFQEAMLEMTRCISGSSQTASFALITNVDGLSTLYVHASPYQRLRELPCR
jgi:hypothetical protein